MKRVSLLIFIQKKEPGLLSIIDDKEKSLVPVFGSVRLIDLYLGPLVRYGFKPMTVLMDEDMVTAQDYLLYGYNDQKLTIMTEPDTRKALTAILRQKRNERFLIFRADKVILADWKRFVDLLLGLGNGNFEIVNQKSERIGFYLNDPASMGSIIERVPGVTNEESGVDKKWEGFTNTLLSQAKRKRFDCKVFGLQTVYDYYNFHLSLMKEISPFIHILSCNPRENPEKENLAHIEGKGFVKDSYISSSCIVEGFVENSVLFPQVKVAPRARVYNSVIMGNNYIGEGALIQNAVLCENGQFSKVTPNIGVRARIGEDDVSGANGKYPNYIYRGVTLIGQNVEIPPGFRISRNCYIPSGIDRTLLKGRERVKAGDSVTMSL